MPHVAHLPKITYNSFRMVRFSSDSQSIFFASCVPALTATQRRVKQVRKSKEEFKCKKDERSLSHPKCAPQTHFRQKQENYVLYVPTFAETESLPAREIIIYWVFFFFNLGIAFCILQGRSSDGSVLARHISNDIWYMNRLFL